MLMLLNSKALPSWSDMIEEGPLPGRWQRWHSHGWPRDRRTNVVGDMLVCRLGCKCEGDVKCAFANGCCWRAEGVVGRVQGREQRGLVCIWKVSKWMNECC